MTPRPCLVCGDEALSGTGRCAAHPLVRQQASSAQRGYDAEWRRLRRAVLERDHWTCAYCGAPATTVDHVVALASFGARLDETNLVACCSACNSAKRDTPADEFVTTRNGTKR